VLTFLIPIRHPESVSDWRLVRSLVATTLRSVAAQTHDAWACYMALERGAEIEDPPPGVRVVPTDIPDPDLPHEMAARAAGIRRDKGARLVAALRAARAEGRAGGHLMVCDYDDLVSRRLAEYSARHPDADGWTIERGHLWDGGRWTLLYPGLFHELCGTSIVVHARHLTGPGGPLDRPEAAERMLGSHKFLAHDLAAAGTPLEPLPFPGAVYRMGTGLNAMNARGLLRWAANPRRIRRHPRRQLRSLAAMRPVGGSFEHEFMGAASGGPAGMPA
jgi:hypothetical protein